MHKDELESTITQLDRTSQTLTRLRETSQEVNDLVMQSPSAVTKNMISFLQKIQKKAHSLYWAIATSWTKPCHDTHAARLYLENRIDSLEAVMKRPGTSRTPDIEFKIALEGWTGQGSSIYHTCSIEVLHLDAFQPQMQGAAIVSFSIPNSSVGHVDHAMIKAMDDICDTIGRTQTVQESLKLFLRHDDKLCYCHTPIQVAKAVPIVNDGDLVSLQEILQQKQLSLKKRVRLSAILASSAMQLHTTPWFTSLRKDSFLFVEHKDATTSWLDVDHPFVSCSFSRAATPATKAQAEAELLDLGIVIIELWHNMSIEAFASKKGLQLLDTYDSRQATARAWLRETEEDMLPPIYNAARRCVECRFAVLDVDWNDKKVNASVFEGVVKPLWDNVRER